MPTPIAESQAIEDDALSARRLIQESQIKIRDAAWTAQEQRNYELSKSLRALDNLLASVTHVLISLPRLKG